jgi:hypothetical protein
VVDAVDSGRACRACKINFKYVALWEAHMRDEHGLGAISIAKLIHEDDGTAIDHPTHYGGADNPYEAIKVIEAWQLDFHIGNAVKYISRAGKKDPNKIVEDLRKARWYIDRAIQRLEGHK